MNVGVPYINGVEYTHADIKVVMFGVPIIGITAIDYGDPQQIELNYGTQNKPVSRGYGNTEPFGTITMTLKEVQRLTAAAPFNDIKNIPDFDIGVNYLTEAGDFVRHKLVRCRFKGRNPNSQVGNSQIEEALELSVVDINYNAI